MHGDRPLGPKGHVWIEVSASINRYHGVVSRIGRRNIHSEISRFFGVSAQALTKMVEAMRDGVASGAVDAIGRQFVNRHDCSKCWRIRAAYSLGLSFPPGLDEGHIIDIKPGDDRVPGAVQSKFTSSISDVPSGAVEEQSIHANLSPSVCPNAKTLSFEPHNGTCSEIAMLKGVFAAMLTPLTRDGEIDRRGMVRLARWLLENGCHGVLLFGTTGEFPSFSVEERMAALDHLVETGIPAERLLVGTGASAVPDAVALSRHATRCGCAGVLVIPPYYFKEVLEDGLFTAFAEVVEGVGEDLRLYLYHFPAMSAVPITLRLLDRLQRAFPRQMVGVKDSSGDLNNIRAMIEGFPRLAVFTGDDDLLLPVLRLGGAGSITAGANIAPHYLVHIFANWRRAGADVREKHRTLQELWSGLLLKYPVTEALKEILADDSGDPDWLHMRAPLARLPEPRRRDLLQGLRATSCKLLESQRQILRHGDRADGPVSDCS